MKASTSKRGSRRAAVVRSPSVAVLGLHRLGTPPPGSWETWFLVGEETFRRFLRVLRRGGWNVVSLDELLAGLDDPAQLPERAALLTFDDGYASAARVALRLLGEAGLPGVFFVPSDFVGRMNEFEADTDEPEEPICSEADLRALVEGGISVQSHAASHTTFSRLDRDALNDEIVRSKQALEVAVGRPVEALAYPYGDVGSSPDETAAALAAAGYRAAFGYGGGPAEPGSVDRYRIPRLALGPDSDLRRELVNG